MPRRSRWRARPAPSPSLPASAAPAGASCSCPSWSLVDLPGVECRFHHGDDFLLAGCTVVIRFVGLDFALTDRESEGELVARDLVENLGEERRVLGLLGQITVKGRRGRKFDHQPVAVEPDRLCLRWPS